MNRNVVALLSLVLTISCRNEDSGDRRVRPPIPVDSCPDSVVSEVREYLISRDASCDSGYCDKGLQLLTRCDGLPYSRNEFLSVLHRMQADGDCRAAMYIVDDLSASCSDLKRALVPGYLKACPSDAAHFGLLDSAKSCGLSDSP